MLRWRSLVQQAPFLEKKRPLGSKESVGYRRILGVRTIRASLEHPFNYRQ